MITNLTCSVVLCLCFALGLPKLGAAQSAEQHFTEGQRALDEENYPLAIRAYTKALRLNPQFTEAYLMRSLAKLYSEDRAGAIADCTQLLQLSPNHPDALLVRGNILVENEDYIAALADYNLALEHKPDWADVFYLRGICKAKMGQTQAACADLDKAQALGYAEAAAALQTHCQ